MIFLKNCSNYSRSLIPCSPPDHLDPRTHLNGPFISIRKVQKHQDLARIRALEVVDEDIFCILLTTNHFITDHCQNQQERRNKLRELIRSDRQKWQCELSKQGLTLYTDTLL